MIAQINLKFENKQGTCENRIFQYDNKNFKYVIKSQKRKGQNNYSELTYDFEISPDIIRVGLACEVRPKTT